MLSILWIIFSYLLGSLPFGYLIGRLSGKNVLEIGWRKTSGSNVFKNVGKWQGALTGILDVLKGYFAVLGAQKLGLPAEIQILSGVAAVTGHNWSIFLRFSGGRGIGTFIGAFFALSPRILGFSLIPLISLALIWNASIGTLLFLATAIFLSLLLKQFEIAGIFTLISLAPILIKRLSPVKEIPQAKNPLILARNRLLFDNDEALFDLRIERLLKKKAERTSSVLHALLSPLLLPSKIGWKAAKIGAKAAVSGVKIAAKPLQKILISEKVVTELRIEDFKMMMLAASKKIVLHQEEINRINVWPVADKDTGYNLAATLLGIEGVIGQKEYKSFLELTQDIRDASMINARGNAGMIFTGYLIRFLDQIKNLELADGLNLGLAMRKGAKAARLSIMNPTEGTILDTMKAAGEKAYEITRIKKEKNIINVLEEAHKESTKALEETKEKLETLKQNDVVDAGALGFVKILEAWLECLKGNNLVNETPKTEGPAPRTKEEKLEHRYDLVFRIKRTGEKGLKELKLKLSQTGSSIDIVESENEVKFHVHVNSPEEVRELVKDFEILEWRTEDMSGQIKKITKKLPLGLVVGESADLPKEFLEENQIIEIPFSAKFPDGEILKKESLFSELTQAMKNKKPLPVTSAPSFKDFLSGYEKALERFQEVLVIVISSKLSGAYSSARIARSMLERKQRLFVFDCFTAEVGEALVVQKAQELIFQGKNKEEIVEILKELCPKIRIIGGLKDFNCLARSGRASLPEIGAKIISLFSGLGIWFLFSIRQGKVRFFKLRFGKDLARILAKEIENEQKGKNLKAAIAFGNNLKDAQTLKKELEKRENIKISFLSQVSAVVGVYTGPEVLIVGFYPA